MSASRTTVHAAPAPETLRESTAASMQVILESLTKKYGELRAVDLNGFAQPEPRPNPQSGIADIPCQVFVVA